MAATATIVPPTTSVLTSRLIDAKSRVVDATSM
jgi:hypothetical protein